MRVKAKVEPLSSAVTRTRAGMRWHAHCVAGERTTAQKERTMFGLGIVGTILLIIIILWLLGVIG
jgi:hypothetical protein